MDIKEAETLHDKDVAGESTSSKNENNSCSYANVGETGSSEVKEEEEEEPKIVTYDINSLYYDMSGNKLMFIFNHHTFQQTKYIGCAPATRHGTELDVRRLRETFVQIGFTIQEPYNDYTHEEILNKVEEICNMDHRNTSCVIVVILTHGYKVGMVYAADRPYRLSDVYNRILREKKLAGKPKLFFVEGGGGTSADLGESNQFDGGLEVDGGAIPTPSDYFLMRASFGEHASFRNTSEGSWMTQALCDVVDEHGGSLNFFDLMTRVNHEVAKKQTISLDPNCSNMKQIPEISTTLTKHLYLCWW